MSTLASLKVILNAQTTKYCVTADPNIKGKPGLHRKKSFVRPADLARKLKIPALILHMKKHRIT